MLTFSELIKIQSDIPTDLVIDGKNRNAKIMFHKVSPKEIDFNPHYNLNGFLDFQKEHHNTFFANTDYVFSFWYEGKVAEFIGAYKLGLPIIDKVNHPETGKERDRYRFPEMREIDFLTEFKNRLIIKWTNPSANYGRWIDDNKFEICSIKYQADNSIGKLPSDYYKINLDFQHLVKLFEYPVDNSDWLEYLSSRSGVYLILDKSDGQQYIGSAYGTTGFSGRWHEYANSGHGGNKDLKNKDSNNFQFSILYETLNTIDKDKIIGIETMFKNNLGTKVHGLNNN